MTRLIRRHRAVPSLPGAALPGAVLLGALLLTGCDIRSTDVIDAGGPATIQVFPGREDRALLFFRSGGALMPVARPGAYETPSVPSDASDQGTAGTGTAGTTTGTKTLVALFAGPLPAEREVGLTDGLPELPSFDGDLGAPPGVELTEDSRTLVTLPLALGGLDDTAIRQVICTVAFARDAEGDQPVQLRGTDGTLEPARCDAGIGPGVEPRPAFTTDADRP